MLPAHPPGRPVNAAWESPCLRRETQYGPERGVLLGRRRHPGSFSAARRIWPSGERPRFLPYSKSFTAISPATIPEPESTGLFGAAFRENAGGPAPAPGRFR
jgi:hypothetical protein